MMKEFNFSHGTPVEVKIDPDNYLDAWFPATFIKQVRKNTCLVECESSKENGIQKVTVYSHHIRPSPPCSSSKTFTLLEKVDAFYEYHWLSGVVTKILAEGRYIVYFKCTKKEKELSYTDLRPHLEWTNGKWVHSSQENLALSSSEKKSYAINDGFKENILLPGGGTGIVKENVGDETLSTALMKFRQNVPSTPGCENANYNGMTPRNNSIKQTSVSGDSIQMKPTKQCNEKTASNVALSSEACKSIMIRTMGSNNGTHMLADWPLKNSSLKQSEKSKQHSASADDKGCDEKLPSKRKRGRPRKLQILAGDIHADAVRGSPNGSDVDAPHTCVVLGLSHNGKLMCKEEEPKNSMEVEDKHCNTSADHQSVVNDVNNKSGEQQDLKRKRGRPPKVLVQDGGQKTNETEFVEGEGSVSYSKGAPERHPQTTKIGKSVSEVKEPIAVFEPVGSSDTTPSKKRAKIVNHEIKHPSDVRELNTRSMARRMLKRQLKSPEKTVNGEEDIDETIGHMKGVKGRQQHRKLRTKDNVYGSRDGVNEVSNGGIAKDVEPFLPRTSSNVFDDQPLSAWVEGAHPPAIDGSGLVTESSGNCDEMGDEHDQSEKKSTGQPKGKVQERKNDETLDAFMKQDCDALVRQDGTHLQRTSIFRRDNEDLPFVKNSLVWEMIETSEVFKRIPQKPHFRPLLNCKEECREGLAIGNMVTFSNLVERVCKFQFGDPRNLLDGYMEALDDLEEQGFNVTPVRDVLSTMIAIKDKTDKAQHKWDEIKSQIMERNQERSRIDEEIVELDKEIAELKEKRAVAVSKREMKDAEIVVLELSVDAVKVPLEKGKQEFERVISSLSH